jgi:hypothetical protein
MNCLATIWVLVSVGDQGLQSELKGTPYTRNLRRALKQAI